MARGRFVSLSSSIYCSWLLDCYRMDECRFYLLACKFWCIRFLPLILPILIGFLFTIIFLASECGTYCVMIRVVRCVSVYCWTFIKWLGRFEVEVINMSPSYMGGFIHKLLESICLEKLADSILFVTFVADVEVT